MKVVIELPQRQVRPTSVLRRDASITVHQPIDSAGPLVPRSSRATRSASVTTRNKLRSDARFNLDAYTRPETAGAVVTSTSLPPTPVFRLLPHRALEDHAYPLPGNTELHLKLGKRKPGGAETADFANLVPGQLGTMLVAMHSYGMTREQLFARSSHPAWRWSCLLCSLRLNVNQR